MVHYQKFDLLTHPLCELFLHLKWLKGRWISWTSTALNLIFTILVTCLALVQYGQMEFILGKYSFNSSCSAWGNYKDAAYPCYTEKLIILGKDKNIWVEP